MQKGMLFAGPTLEDQRGVGAAKAKRIRKRVFDRRFARLIWDIVQVALRIGILQIDGRRQNLVTQGEHADARFQTTSDSRMTMPAPSPTTKPSRPASQGRLARAGSSLRVESAFMAANPPTPIGVMVASVPPQIIISAAPRSIILNESPMACAEAEQAVAVAGFGPPAP